MSKLNDHLVFIQNFLLENEYRKTHFQPKCIIFLFQGSGLVWNNPFKTSGLLLVNDLNGLVNIFLSKVN